MTVVSTSSKPSTSARRMRSDLELSIVTSLADPSKYNSQLVRRLSQALNMTTKPLATAKGKQKLVQPGGDVEEKRVLAMRAANAALQSLGTVFQSEWSALNLKATSTFSMESVISIVSAFRMAVAFLRNLNQGTIDTERVVSGFVGKLIALQLYEPALELLHEIKVKIVRSYDPSPQPVPKDKVTQVTSKLSLTRSLHLIQYPLPGPRDPTTLILIGTSLGQAITLVSTVMMSHPNDITLETFMSSVEGQDGPISWHSLLPTDHADRLLNRVYRALTTTFSSSSTPSNVLLRLRRLALRCLLCKVNLDPEPFWTQTTNYMTSHGKSVIKSEDAPRAVKDVVAFFEGIVTLARGRSDAAGFMSGSAFLRCCEVALVFAKHGDVSNLTVITQFIHADNSKTESPASSEDDFSAAKLHVIFAQSTASLETSPDDPHIFDALSQCTHLLPRLVDLFFRPEFRSKAVYSVERLRRACCRFLDDANEHDLRKTVKSLLVAMVERLEHWKILQVDGEFTACIVESLCCLSKAELLPSNTMTHTTSYDFLQRAVTLVGHDIQEVSNNELHPNLVLSQVKVICVLAGTFQSNAVLLYRDNRHATAIRFLVKACELGAKACQILEGVEANDPSAVSDRMNEQQKAFKSQLPKQWKLLGDCYYKIGERKLAHGAFLESLRQQSFETLSHSAASFSPSQLASGVIYQSLASLVKRITHIAVFDLLMQGEASLRETLCTLGVPNEVVGLVLEWQAASLEEFFRPEAQLVLARILQDALYVYGPDFPIRRARVILRQLDLAYSMDNLSVPVHKTVADIQDLLCQDPGKDIGFSDMRQQYTAIAHIWMAFHAYRHSRNNSDSAIIFTHAALASKLLRCMFPATQTPTIIRSPKNSPKVIASGSARRVVKVLAVKKKGIPLNTTPVTPKPRKKTAQITYNQKTRESPLNESPTEAGPSIDRHLTTSIQMIAQLMGLLGHVVLKLQFLNILQRMTERSAGPSDDDFVRASVDAANEYVRLGKIERAMAIYVQALSAMTTTTVSDEVRVSLLLHYAETHALNGNAEKSLSIYEEAHSFAERLEDVQYSSTTARIRARVLALERSALASTVFSVIKVAQDDPHTAISTLGQSLRLWNRALHALSRLSAPPTPVCPNPFDMNTLAEALPTISDESVKAIPRSQEPPCQNTVMDGLQWRIAEGLLQTLFGLGRAYFLQGTVRAAEYFIERARDLATSFNSPAMLSRALARTGELQLHQGDLERAASTLSRASELLHDIPGIDAANINRLRAHYSQLREQYKQANIMYREITYMLSELEKVLDPVADKASSPRRPSLTRSPGRLPNNEVLFPELLAIVLRQQIWFQRNEPQGNIKPLLDQLSALPPTRGTKAEKLVILAKLGLHSARVQFRTDLFLSSLTESTIALPMGASSRIANLSPSVRQMSDALSAVERMFWASLETILNGGRASDVRDAAMSLALIRSFQASLGVNCNTNAHVAAGLLDASAAITLRRELIDNIEQKFPQLNVDDLVWPTLRGERSRTHGALQFDRSMGLDEGNEHLALDLESYWSSVRDRCYSSYILSEQSISTSCAADLLPIHWTVVSISITEDKSTMFFSRQRHKSEPLIFCIPLERHGRKEEDATNRFTYVDAVGQLKDILDQSDLSAEEAKNVSSDDREGKTAWWAKRATLDRRMRELLENIEFCWLGAFKTILSEPVKTPQEVLNSLRNRFEKVFKRNLAPDKKRMSRVKFDDALMECFACLSPKCRDEELEDLVYFVLDLYQFHGVHVALSEIDIDQITVELRMELEEHASKNKNHGVLVDDAHLFLILDKNVQGIPWESIPILRGRSVSRIPSLSFLVDRIELAKLQRKSVGVPVSPVDRAVVNPKNTFYVLNPSGDLTKSQARFGTWAKEMETVGWRGIVGQEPGEQMLLNAFSKSDLVIYIGHGGAEKYVRSSKIRSLQRCAATMLWGCSSGEMRDMGEFDRVGTPYNYMLAGCPTLVACLWDVTDNELDKISRSVFDTLRLDVETVNSWRPEQMDEAPVSLVTAVGKSRDACKLKYLTGAAPVVYGIPFYL